MLNSMKENIFLTGFSGSGKTSAGRLLAARLNYEFIDTDLQIEADTGRSVPAIFEQEGEAAFRELERQTLERICEHDRQVVSTGGGLVLAAANRATMTANGYVVCLEARPETIYVRLLLDTTATTEAAGRPLLRGPDQFERIQQLKAERQPLYAQADWTIHTDFLAAEEVAAEIERVLDLLRRRGAGQRGGPGSPASPGAPHSVPAAHFHRGGSIGEVVDRPASQGPLTVRTSTGSYPVLFGQSLLSRAGQLLKELAPEAAGRKIYILTDKNVWDAHGHTVWDSLRVAGFPTQTRVIPAGEESKSLAQLEKNYEWLAAQRAERKDLLVALGGGVVGDLAGFTAATWLRGIPFVQLPTTLLAMVDSSVGGKTGVNLPHGKNLIGAFYPPRAVLADIGTLASLPERDRNSGWAEVVKHAIIPGAGDEADARARLGRLEAAVERLKAGDPDLTAAILRESVAVKAGVVEQDERETGLRITLNYGHTYAHALETAGGYSLLQHGEAVAIGLHGAARLAQLSGLCQPNFVERQRRLLESFGLPVTARPFGLDRAAVLANMQLDKKVEAGAIRWVLPLGVGRLEIRRDVPHDLVVQVLDELL